MRRILSMAVLVTALAACSGGSGSATSGESEGAEASGPVAPAPGGGPPSTAGAGGGGLLAAAQAVTDVCLLVPMDLAATLVPNGSAPQSQTFPPFKCTISNGTQVLEVTLGAFDTGRPTGAPTVSGFDAGAYAEHLNSGDLGEVYLTVPLSPDVGSLYVEIVDPSAGDRTADAVAVAKRVLDAIQ